MTQAPDDILEVGAEASYTATHPPTDAPAGGFTRWTTWAEAIEMAGWKDQQVSGLRAALAAMEARGWPTIERAFLERVGGYLSHAGCSRPEGCVCGGDTARVRESCRYFDKAGRDVLAELRAMLAATGEGQ